MSRISQILRAGLLGLLVLPATTSCDKISALAQRVRGKSPAPEATVATAAPGENLAGGKVHHILESDYDRLVADPDRLVLVDFYADWCGPCRALAPTLATLASENPERLLVIKVNVDGARSLASRLGVRGIPDIRFYRGGKQIDAMVGAAPLDDMRRIVQAHLPVKAPVPVAAAPAAAPVGMVDKLKQAITKKDEAAAPPPEPASQPPPTPVEPPIQPVKKGDDWLPEGMTRDRAPERP
jgi:thioredoxin 1